MSEVDEWGCDHCRSDGKLTLSNTCPKCDAQYPEDETMSEWQPIETAPEGKLVETRIKDEAGERNVQKLIRNGSLWFTSDKPDAMYIYYRPTHWRQPHE